MKKILGMGNALTDILLQIENDEVLFSLNMPKGSMQLINDQQSANISEFFQKYEKKMATGGSASNTINGITKLGAVGGFVGKVGKDEVGNFFTKDSIQNGAITHLFLSETPSGHCTVLVSPDGERTLCTFLGAACELLADDLNAEMFQGYDIFHIEGYLVQNHDLIRKAVRLAKESGLLVSIDLASYNVVESNLDFLNEIIEKYVDIVFANEEESHAFTGLDPLESVNEIAKNVKIAVVKIGKNGSYIKSGSEMYKVDALKANCIDTTGAGDLYAAGFLYGLARDYPLEICGKIGSLVSGNVVEVLGAKMSDQVWKKILTEMKNIVK